MKKTPLKRKTALRAKKPLNGSKLAKRTKKPSESTVQPRKRRKKTDLQRAKEKLWNECKRITRERFPPYCYTCGCYVEGNNDHTGHGKPKGALPLRYKYDIRNLRRQCMMCNVHRGGMTDIFIAKLEQEEEGLQFLHEACFIDPLSNAWRIRQDTPSLGGKDATTFIQNLLKQYKSMSFLPVEN